MTTLSFPVRLVPDTDTLREARDVSTQGALQ